MKVSIHSSTRPGTRPQASIQTQTAKSLLLHLHPKQRNPRQSFTVHAAAATSIAESKPSTSIQLLPKSSGRREEQAVLNAIKDVKGRGKSGLDEQQQAVFDKAVAALEASGGVARPTASPLLQGRWRLLFTSRPSSASPIQRSFTAVEQFSVFQEILNVGSTTRVNNVVDFGPAIGYLKVEAEASTDTKPIPGFTPRKGAGLPFGILGTSMTTPPAKKDLRVDFQFDQAAFYFNSLPFSIPYPVPFRLLGDERKGWIDITYLSPDGKFRISRGNKGTLFVLVKDESPREALLEAITKKTKLKDSDIEQLALTTASESKTGIKNPAKSKGVIGKWRLRWTQQGANANILQKTLAGSVANWQIISEDGSLENRVALAPGVTVRALATCEPDSATRTGVVIEQVVFEVGPLKFEIPLKRDARGFVDWLYVDETLRITRGSKGSLFVHTRDD